VKRLACRFLVFAVIALAAPLASAEEAFALEGLVRGPDGEGIADIGVVVKVDGARLETTTDTAGAFAFPDTRIYNQAIVLLTGDAGTGRVAIPAHRAVDPLELEYPVRSEVVILHDNDQHFDWNFIDAIESEIHRTRSEHTNVFLLNAGDIFVRHADRWGQPGNYGWYARQAAFSMETMNRLRYDAMTGGNHEFDAKEYFTLEALEKAQFPLLAANMLITTDRLPRFAPFTVLRTAEGYTIAVLGLSTGNFVGVARQDPIETAKKYVHLAGDYDLFVALTHIGFNSDRDLAEEVPELDVIIGGHSHTLLEEAEMVNGVLVAQAGGGGHYFDAEKPAYLGKITVILENGVPIEKSGFVTRFTAAGSEALTAEPAGAAAN